MQSLLLSIDLLHEMSRCVERDSREALLSLKPGDPLRRSAEKRTTELEALRLRAARLLQDEMARPLEERKRWDAVTRQRFRKLHDKEPNVMFSMTRSEAQALEDLIGSHFGRSGEHDQERTDRLTAVYRRLGKVTEWEDNAVAPRFQASAELSEEGCEDHIAASRPSPALQVVRGTEPKP